MESEEGISATITSNSSDMDDFDETASQPSGRRWDPLGAAKNDDDDDGDTQTVSQFDSAA